MITASLTTACRLEIQLTATDIRTPIWRYVKMLEDDAEQTRDLQHRQGLVQKVNLSDPRYLRLSFRTDFPTITCMHPSVGLFPGISLENAIAHTPHEASFVRKAWRDEHSLHALWEGFDLDAFAVSWKNLMDVLAEIGPIRFQHTLGLHPDTFPSICAELLPLFGQMDQSSRVSKL